jgi:Tfp pilus assembly protein PilF
MKKLSIFIMLGLLTILFCGFNEKSFATDYSMEQCRKMIELGNDELSEQDVDSAKMYYRRAIQSNPFCTEAWVKYDELMKLISKEEPINWDKLRVKSKKSEDPFEGF